MRTRDKKRIVRMFLRGMGVWSISDTLWSARMPIGPKHIEEVIREYARSLVGPREGKKR